MASSIPEQELRLAVVMTGGVSLAIWMGGVAAELDKLVRTLDVATAQQTPEQRAYADLLGLSRYRPRVDVVSGTSAGGVNGALLGGAVARRKTLDGLRDIWLKVADFSELLRSPFEKDQQSLLKGDEYFTPGLQQGIETLLGKDPVTQGADHPVELLITTTLLNGEDSGLVDSFGTRIPDVHHNALFRFDREGLMSDPKLVSRLALAARSSASFPIAFEPSWVPYADDAADDGHPAMNGIADFHESHFVIDGGVLVNRPIEPALRSIFAMPATDTDVCRVLLYVVPDPGETLVAESDEQDEPPTLTDVSLKSLVGIPRTQSIARDLERLKEHDARVTAQRDARDFILTHCFEGLQDDVDDLLARYRERRARREVEQLLDELTLRYRPTMEAALAFKPIEQGDLARDLSLAREETLPESLEGFAPDAAHIAPWGLDSLERAATVTLDLARRGWRRAGPGAVRTALTGARDRVHTALESIRAERAVRRAALRDKQVDEEVPEWAGEMLGLMRRDARQLQANAVEIATALGEAADAIRGLADPAELGTLADRLSPESSDDGERLRRLFALEVIQDAAGITAPVVEQPIRLLQNSANTRDGISPYKTAAEKLTGMRLVHFAAFYKPSWRANDWMWGRLDAAGWIAQLLLDPSRLDLVYAGLPPQERVAEALTTIRAIALGPPGRNHEWLQRVFDEDEAEIEAELAWLNDPDPKVPPSLPKASMAVARRIQIGILADELPAIADAVGLDEARDALSFSGRNFRAAWDRVGSPPEPEELKKALVACEFATDGFREEYDSGLLARSASGAVATTTSALAGSHSGLPDFIAKSKVMTSARGVGLALNGLVDTALRRSKGAFAIIIGLTALAGGALGVAATADGTQPALTGFGFAVVLAAWVVGLWRSPKLLKPRSRPAPGQPLEPPQQGGLRWLARYARYLLLTVTVVILCVAIAWIPWAAERLIDPCPKKGGKVTDCFRGDVEKVITDLEPAFIVLAIVLGAMVFGWKAAAPGAVKPAQPNPREPAAGT